MALKLVTVFLTAALVVNLYLISVTFKHCQSDKKHYLIFALAAIFANVVGYLLEINATSAGAALTALKIRYLGNCYIPPLFLLFIMDYCRINLRRIVFNVIRGLLLIVPAINLAFIWTIEHHELIYRYYFFDRAAPFQGLQIARGPLYPMVYIIAIICAVSTLVILFKSLFTWDPAYRRPLILLLITAATPLVANMAYAVSVFFLGSGAFDFTPFTLIGVNVVFYLAVTRLGMFDFVPIAYNTILDSVDQAFIILNRDMSCAAVNAAGKDLFPGIAECRHVPASFAENWPEVLNNISSLDLTSDIRFTLTMSGKQYNYSAVIDEIRESNKLFGYIITIKDVTTLWQLMLQLELAAYTDALTGIYNRRHFMELAEKEYERAKRASMPCYAMILDIDHFKSVNDTYGHAAGDEVLRFVAKRMGETVRSYDLFARYGGEEFVIMLYGNAEMNTQLAYTTAERIRMNVANSACSYDGIDISVTVSIGIASGEGTSSLEMLLRRADEAMYSAKTTGRDRVVCYDENKMLTV